MSTEINSNLYPNGGYFFEEADGIKIKGASWPAVERAVKKYRENRGVPVGDIHAEVMTQACERNPALCFEQPTGLPKPQTTLKGRVFEWLAARSRMARQSPLDYVGDAEARRRAAICRKCPMQKKISHLCSTCSDSRAALRKSVLAERVPVDVSIEACSVLGSDLQSAVHLAEQPETNPDLPDFCWRRTI